MHIDQSTFMHAYSADEQIPANKKRNTELYMKMRQKHTHLGTGLAVRITSTGVLGYKIVFSLLLCDLIYRAVGMIWKEVVIRYELILC